MEKSDELTLRDYFAAQYLSGVAAVGHHYSNWEALAEDCYGAADALMRHRAQASMPERGDAYQPVDGDPWRET